jgi:hypothetical protein
MYAIQIRAYDLRAVLQGQVTYYTTIASSSLVAYLLAHHLTPMVSFTRSAKRNSSV